jgi:hypothetical protein
MALVSPGQLITITDESQYVSGAVGTVPLIIIATEQDKLSPAGTTATGTTKANAGKLQAYTSQREWSNAFGYPTFKQSSAGTPLHGDERNEYGAMTGYSTLGVANLVYAIRADINLADLRPTTVRPVGTVANGTYWMDLATTDLGVTEWNATTGEFVKQPVLFVTASTDITTGAVSGYSYPVQSVGDVGSYAAVVSAGGQWNVFRKSSNNSWAPVGSTQWSSDIPTIKGVATAQNILADATESVITINSIQVQLANTSVDRTLSDVVGAINLAAIPGVTARAVNSRLELLATSLATAKQLVIASNVPNTLSRLGITAGAYNIPASVYGNYIQIPSWRSTDTSPRPSGSVYVKTTATGNGANVVVKKFNAGTGTFTTVAAPLYQGMLHATYGLDSSGGGFNIPVGTVWVQYDNDTNNDDVTYKLFSRNKAGATKIVANAVGTTPFQTGNSFNITVGSIGTAAGTTYAVTLTGTSRASFVSAVLAAAIPEVTALVESTGAISLTHRYGGVMYLNNTSGTPTVDAGFVSGVTGITESGSTLILSNFSALTYTYSIAQPTQNPEDGKLWYYSSAAEVDVMINTTSGWQGYQNELSDARGYDLTKTDPKGVIVSAGTPVTQTDNTPLVAGDLWLDTGDLENWPAISRYTGTQWKMIDGTDQVGQGGILYADARWSATGTVDVVNSSIPTITSLLTSDYLDNDAPDYRLYPRGMLMFNMRRSGYNVKKFSKDALGIGQHAWITASGLKDDGSMNAGHQAQRHMVVSAMKGAIDSNTSIREDQFVFNLLVAPGYPELIQNMVALNNDRANTGFVIGDTPMRLLPGAVDLVNWSNNSDNTTGLTTNDPYLAVYYPGAASTNDVQGNPIVVPPSHIALRTYLHNDNVSFPWFAPAGTRRGLVDNASSVGYIDPDTGEYNPIGVNQGLRDVLQQTNINPITNLPGIGLVIWGQKTRNPVASALDRVNVARLVNYIRAILATVGNGFLFEPNDKITRDQIKGIISGAINDLISKRGIYDYVVVCDESNNTPTRIARNELYVDIAIEPMKDVEFIYIPIRLYNPGAIATLGG